MIGKLNRPVKLWVIMVAALVVWMLSTGFQRADSAGKDDLYDQLKVFSDVIELIQKDYVDEVEAKDLIQKAIQGMLQGLDPHSSLLPPDAFEDLQIDTKGKFTGIGIHITMQNGFVTVISPIEDTPAHRAGIEPGDRIVKVDGQLAKDLREAVRMMRGPKGSKVVVTIMREGFKKPIDYEILRDEIPIQSVKHIPLKPGYGYVRISNFTGTTTQEFEKALEKIEAAELVERDHGPLDGFALPVDARLKAPDVLLNGGQFRPAPLELDVLGGQLPRDEAAVEVDPGERREDGRFLAGLGLEPRLEVLDLPVDAVQALLEVGDVLVLGGGR